MPRRSYKKGRRKTPRNLARAVKSVILKTAETKHVTLGFSGTTSSTWAVHEMPHIAQGDDSDNRDGNLVWLKNIQLVVELIKGSAATQNFPVRVMLVWSVESLVASSFPGSMIAPPDYDSMWTFYDKVHMITHTGGVGEHKVFKKTIHLNRRLFFDGTSSGDFSKGTMFLAISTIAGTGPPTYTSESFVTFKDI